MSGTGSNQRQRTKTSDLTELFRPAHGSRHLSKNAVVEPAASASVPPQPDKPAASKSRRSMLPFLGRKKSAEQPAPVPSRKSFGGSASPNTARPSLGNGHTMIMITPSPDASSSIVPPLPSTLPPLNVSPQSLGSKFAAHFTPLRSPSKAFKSRHTMASKLADPSSADSPRSSMQSRSTTPRPHRTPQSPVVHEGVTEASPDRLLQPHQPEKPLQAAKSAPSPVIYLGIEPPVKSTDVTSASPTPPSSPCLQFPIPPPMVGRPSSALERPPPRRSGDSTRKEFSPVAWKGPSPSFKAVARTGSQSPSTATDTASDRTVAVEYSSGDDYRRGRNRGASFSGSDTDASRPYDSSPQMMRIRQSPTLLKSAMKQPPSYQGATGKPPSVLPSTGSLPSPPLSPPGSGSSPSSVISLSSSNPSTTRARSPRPSAVPQRPRANTLSSTTMLSGSYQPGSSAVATYQKAFASENKTVPGVSPDASPEELWEALSLQRKKYSQLQEYIITITKRYEDDRVALTKTVEKLERDIRKKTREIEGLRWLVIHNGALEDINAAASLARSSLSTQDESDRPDTDQSSSSVTSKRSKPRPDDSPERPSSGPIILVQRGLGIDFTHARQLSATLEALPQPLPTPVNLLSAIPEQSSLQCDITRADRQKAREERRATRTLRRISVSSGSSLSSGANQLMQSSSPDPSLTRKLHTEDSTEKLHSPSHN